MSEHLSEALKHLKGKCVTLTFEDEQLQIGADDGWSLHIYNAYTLSFGGKINELTHTSLRLKLVDCVLDDVKMVMLFSSDGVLAVDLTEGGYSGPEAMQLNGPGALVIIWA